MAKIVISLVLLFSSLFLSNAQTTTDGNDRPARISTADTSESVIKKEPFFKRLSTNWKRPYPNATRAGIYSLVFPGAGQFYNKRYWKVPMVWGAVGGMIGLAKWNKNRYECYTTAYELRILDQNNIIDDDLCNSQAIRTTDQLNRARQSFNRQYQLAIMGTAAVWVLQVLEAYVDAHLRDFDISDDLGFQFRLTTHENEALSTPLSLPSLGLTYSF